MGILSIAFGGRNGLVRSYDAELSCAFDAMTRVVHYILTQKGLSISRADLDAVIQHVSKNYSLANHQYQLLDPVVAALHTEWVKDPFTNATAFRVFLLSFSGHKEDAAALAETLDECRLLKQFYPLSFPAFLPLKREVGKCVEYCEGVIPCIKKAYEAEITRKKALQDRNMALIKQYENVVNSEAIRPSTRSVMLDCLPLSRIAKSINTPEEQHGLKKIEIILNLIELFHAGVFDENGLTVLIQKLPKDLDFKISNWRVHSSGILIDGSDASVTHYYSNGKSEVVSSGHSRIEIVENDPIVEMTPERFTLLPNR